MSSLLYPIIYNSGDNHGPGSINVILTGGPHSRDPAGAQNGVPQGGPKMGPFWGPFGAPPGGGVFWPSRPRGAGGQISPPG